MSCATPMTAWPPCCASSAMPTAPLALFNGGAESDPRMIAGLLARDDIRGQPFHHARHSGYQRMTAARTLCLLDCGRTPEGAFALDAHAGACGFELSSGSDRIVVNCGAGGLAHQAWNTALRATAAHSTLVLSDTSSAHILTAGIARDLLGPRLMGGPVAPVSRRMETAQGWTVEAMHDAYVAMFGVRHERQVTMSPQGLMVTGRDRLVPVEGRTAAERPGRGPRLCRAVPYPSRCAGVAAGGRRHPAQAAGRGGLALPRRRRDIGGRGKCLSGRPGGAGPSNW